jgi:NAD(P)-dependent dehydrogenase (short-subunit alcohol dehydrogenase family)
VSLASALDTALDRTVALGYGRTGLAVRRRLPTWPADPPRMEGKVVAVTGATGGLGLAAAQQFAALGASVRVVGRSAEMGAAAVASIDGDARFLPCDVGSLASLEEFTAAFLATEPRLDVLVNNAGVMPPERALSPDGVELAFATNVLGPFVLIDRLAGLLAQTPPSRVINVSSGGMYGQRLDGDDLQNADYAPLRAYARTKRAEVVLTEQWSGRLDARGVVVHAMHPGWAATPGITESMARFAKVVKPVLRTPEQGADTIVWLGAAPEPASATGLFWQDRRPRPTHLFGLKEESATDRQQLWDHCVELAGGLRSVR